MLNHLRHLSLSRKHGNVPFPLPFPLYAAAAQVWLAKDRDIRVMMFLSILIGMLIMCFILIAETLIEPKNRLSWPYGDLVPGGL